MSRFPRVSCALLALAHVTLAPSTGQCVAAEVLTFGVYTSDKPTSMYRKFKPVLVHLEREMTEDLGMPVSITLRIHKSYEEGQEALVSGAIDFARFGPASYVLAKEREPRIRLLGVEESGGQRFFDGVILVREDSPIRTLSELKGKSFAFGDESSTIGRYLSQALLVENGVRARDLSKWEHLGRHDLVVTAVLYGKFDAGAAKEDTFRSYKEKGLRALATFPNVTKPWVARAGLEDRLFLSLEKALLATRDTAVLQSITKELSGFGRVEDAEYDFVRRGMKAAELFRREAPEAEVEPAPEERPESESPPEDLKPED